MKENNILNSNYNEKLIINSMFNKKIKKIN